MIERLTLGGAGRSLVAAAGASGGSHRVLALRPSDARAVAMARAAGVEMADPAALDPEIAAADIVHIHFWNSPDLFAMLRRPLPPCRVVLTSHVLGDTPPHIMTADLRALADCVVATTPATQADRMIPAAADFRRLAATRPAPRHGFTIGYLGALDFAKLHPDYVAIHAALGGAYQVIVAGSGPDSDLLRRQTVQADLADRFAWLGEIEDIGRVLGAADVFGYPLRDDSFATSELVLHEAMYAGLPCVLLAKSGAAHTIVHGETGFLARDPADYTARLRQLRDDPALRERLGRGARAHAVAHLGAERIAAQVDVVYAELMHRPRRTRTLPPVASGSDAWLQSLGDMQEPFVGSLAGNAGCDRGICAASPALASADAGGVLHYRRFYPEDAALRFWAGLVLFGANRFVLAAGEFKSAGDHGFDADRSAAWLRRAIAAARGYQ